MSESAKVVLMMLMLKQYCEVRMKERCEMSLLSSTSMQIARSSSHTQQSNKQQLLVHVPEA